MSIRGWWAQSDRASRWGVVGALVGVIVCAGLAWGLWGTLHRDPTSALPAVTITAAQSTPRTTPTPSPSATSAEQKAAIAAEDVYRRHVRILDELQASGGKGVEKLKTVAVGTALSDDQAVLAQYRVNHWQGKGTTSIADITVKRVSLKTDPKTYTVPEVLLQSCLDNTNSYAVDSSGKNLRATSAPTHYRELATIRYYPKYGGWLVADISNEGVPSC